MALPAKVPAPAITAISVELRSPWSVYVTTGGEGVFKSEDGGKSWAAVNNGMPGPDIDGLALAPNDGRLHAQIRGKGLFRSMNGARSWERVDNGPAGRMSTLASVNVSTGMGGIFLYAATDQGLVRGPD